MTGITAIIIILVPIAYQVFTLQIKQDRRHKEIKETLKRIEDRLESVNGNAEQSFAGR